MRIIAALAIFMTAFAITANLHIYVQSLRIWIYAWHIFMPVIPIHLTIALLMGTLLKADRVTVMYYLWASLFLILVALSVMAGKATNFGMSEATRYATTFGIGLSFLAAAQNRSLATAGALGIGMAAITSAGISFAEFLNPEYTAIVDQRYENSAIKEDVVSRVGSLHVNPNSNARFMTFGMFVCCFFLTQKVRFLFCLIIGAAVFTTVSRSGMMTWALAMVMLTLLGQFSSGKALSKLVGIAGVGALGVLLMTGQIPKLLESAGLDELMTDSMTNRVSSGFFSQESNSSDTRLELVPLAMELYADNPLFGAGIGKSSSLGDTGLGPHNMLLQIGAEFGTVGLVVYLSLIIIPLRMRSPKATCFFILFTFSGMFAHGILVKAVMAFILPAGIALLSRLDQQQQESRLASRNTKKQRRRRRRRTSRPAIAH